MKILTTNYHISVNRTLMADLHAIGLELILPSRDFAEKAPISFFAPNDQHRDIAKLIDWNEYLKLEPHLILIPCTQLVEDMLGVWEKRGKRDTLVLLTANSDHAPAWRMVPTNFVLSHDLSYQREFTGYKALYFNRPTILREKKTGPELRKSFEERKVKVYINNLEHDPGLVPELEAAQEMRSRWLGRTGYRVPIFGYGNTDGWPSMNETQDHIVDSMFTFVSKRRETWGQLINESMQLGTPGMFLRGLLNSTFTEYLINDDTAILGDTVEELVDKALSLTWPQYETLVNEAYSQSQMFCADDIRREKLRWLFDKAADAVGKE
jgi:hypothetical protein